MNKKYIIILVIAIVGAVGLYIFQNLKKEKDLSSHHNRQYNRIIEAARKSPVGGLAQMGRALNKYKENNGAYPVRLAVLYPDFIPVKAFIDDLQWDYKPSGNNFTLSRTIRTEDDKLLTASIGPDLRLQNKSDIAVASIRTPKQIKAVTETKPPKKSSKTGVSRATATKSRPMAKALTPNIPSTGPKNSRGKSGDTAKPVMSKKRPLPDSEEVSTYKLTEKEKFVEAIQSRQEILVWKNDDGSLGFSNIQYPRSKELTVYDKGEWVQIRRKKLYAHTQKESR